MTLVTPRLWRRTKPILLVLLSCVILSVTILVWPETKKQKVLVKKHKKINLQRLLLDYYSRPHDPFVNQHQYSFSISSSACYNRTYSAVILVHSTPSNINSRALIRRTYGNVRQYRGKLLTVVFLLGAVTDRSLQTRLLQESSFFGDIVQGNFIDSYKNLSMKHVMAMHWFIRNCESDFIVKLDDDSFVNPYRLVEYFDKLPNDGLNIYCKVVSQEERPIRDPNSKSYTPYHQYPFEAFPNFCLGFSYITTPPVWKKLYRESSSQRPWDMDDVFVTGLLATMCGVKRMDIGDVMYECSDMNAFDTVVFNKSVFVLDRRNLCGSFPFNRWLDIQ